jgi:hypothetical protein
MLHLVSGVKWARGTAWAVHGSYNLTMHVCYKPPTHVLQHHWSVVDRDQDSPVIGLQRMRDTESQLGIDA